MIDPRNILRLQADTVTRCRDPKPISAEDGPRDASASQGSESRFNRRAETAQAVSVRPREHPGCTEGAVGDTEKAAEGGMNGLRVLSYSGVVEASQLVAAPQSESAPLLREIVIASQRGVRSTNPKGPQSLMARRNLWVTSQP